MSNTNASLAHERSKKMTSPLETINDYLKDDMLAVNEMILSRMQSNVDLIPRLAAYLIAAGGKRIRPLLTLSTTALYNGDMIRAHKLSSAVEFIHTATLLHDDVVDESDTRRGKDAANLVFGNQASVLVGDFLFSRAFQLMTEDGNLDILRILSSASAIIAEGEVMQLTTAGNIDTTMNDYIEVIKAKTAALFTAACEVGPVIAGADITAAKAMADYGLYLGIAFQIADDALDYMAEREKLGKTVGDDFREGKMTAPILLALQKAKNENNEEELKFWKRVISDLDQKDGDLQTAQNIFEKHDIYSETLKLAHNYGDKAIAALEHAPEHPLKASLKELVNYSITRET
ncbi:MAG: farnesyltranstransferase [Micavibrio sp. TMED27]|nr:farnesyltranstransferase [Micavibrio sp.]OUT89994.1 MAG: farnesyltranstransferase [Micavibrio sp. TMED27]|tara:strand:+ start:451 stop:1488 length:1038 start_codon:yes stop_codon:yes gene_type:complete